MPFTSRMYARTEDRDRLTQFLSDANAGDPTPDYWQPGDLIWGFYQNTVFDPTTSIRLWEDAATGALLGLTTLDTGPSAGEAETQLAPQIRATAEGDAILAEALAWARRVATQRHDRLALGSRQRVRHLAGGAVGGERLHARRRPL